MRPLAEVDEVPSLGSHLGRADTVAERLHADAVDRYRGPFYLGATAPDIRVMLGIDRAHTHFFALDDFEPQDSFARLLEAHPHLRDAAALDAPTRAFLAGYATHLLLDEHYIQRVYRLCFGERSPLAGDLRANVLDRALQYELNRRELGDHETMSRVRTALAGCAMPAGLGFIEQDALVRWLDIAVDIAHQEPTFERFPRMITRHMERAGYGEPEIERVLADARVLIDEAFAQAGAERVRAFLDEAVEVATARVSEYLS